MPRPSFDREAIEAEIDRVRSLGLDELRTLWRTTFRSSPPPAFTKTSCARFLCWHFQEQARGGLDPETAKHLDGLAQGNKPGMDRPRRLKPGTVLLREYQGERHTVTVVANGLARDDLCQSLDHRAGHHRHKLERTALLRPAEWRRANGFAGSGQCAGTRQQATSYSGGQVASGGRGTKSSRR
jgi:Protein of unknown function (DUF2924)